MIYLQFALRLRIEVVESYNTFQVWQEEKFGGRYLNLDRHQSTMVIWSPVNNLLTKGLGIICA
jgi:hypothetical protein